MIFACNLGVCKSVKRKTTHVMGLSASFIYYAFQFFCLPVMLFPYSCVTAAVSLSCQKLDLKSELETCLNSLTINKLFMKARKDGGHKSQDRQM